MQILQLDVRGMPQQWITAEEAAIHYATDSVAWTVGGVCTMRVLCAPCVPSICEGFRLAGRNIHG